MMRGGSWNNDAQNCRSAIRNNNSPDNRNNNVGFHCVFQHSSEFDARVREPKSLAERASRSPGSVPASGYVTRPKRKPSRAGR